MLAAYFLTFLFGCLLTYIVYAKIYEKDNGVMLKPHSVDNYTSAQPPPPFTTDQSPSTVYRSGCLSGRNALGIDCANASCPSDCKTCSYVHHTTPYDDYLYPRYIYNVVPTSHGYHLAGRHGGRHHRDGGGHHRDGGGHHHHDGGHQK